jgi:hypothetical protein
MRLPIAAFTIGTEAIHIKSQQRGTIAGIQRKRDEIQYLFDCDIFTQWLPPSKLQRVPEETTVTDEYDDIEYVGFIVSMTESKLSDACTISLKLNCNTVYEREFPSAKHELARAFYDFLRTQESISRGLLEAIGMEAA